ncbi:hypothetical protein [Thermoanaerobacterium sp. RBIITD]|uniref:hypothetical protein n=1 Tax=Thermoanaerobacterium sp. RBIITD TaxID=1550240 RepID=UPI000BB87847|nr:hypothetical protein [Thermoanaerobacterium sp. RBIITD]SNX54189.1 hypothetical protein SAMN05660242_1825 [Thermoanaerobacterium sp. RBIITD]
MVIDEKILDDFFNGNLDEELLNFVKMTLSMTGLANDIDKAFAVGKAMLKTQAYKEPVERHVYISALILLLLFEFLEYKSFKTQNIEEILAQIKGGLN